MSLDSAFRGTVHQTLNNQPKLFYADLPSPIAKRVASYNFRIADEPLGTRTDGSSMSALP